MIQDTGSGFIWRSALPGPALVVTLLLAGCNGESGEDSGVDLGRDLPADLAVDAPLPDRSLVDLPPPDMVPPTAIHVDDLNDGKKGSGTTADPYRELQVAIDAAPNGATLLIHAGTHKAKAVAYADPTCGNCSDADFSKGASATRGFLVKGKKLHLVGQGPAKTVLQTNAGYGLLFDDAGNSSVRQLKVTGGKRDADPQATDAGIVVRKTTLYVQRISVSGNDDLYSGTPDPVVGVGGIFGREGAVLTILDSVIEDNSWDGIALYRGIPKQADSGARATVRNCRIGCTSGCITKRGRGAGIGATWDSVLIAEGNVIHHYWKGIGTFGTSHAVVDNNVVRDQHGWGIIASGNSMLNATNNTVVRNGTTGMAAWSSTVTGSFVNNIVSGNGIATKEWVGKKTGIWFNAPASAFKLSYNLVHGNSGNDVCKGGTPEGTACSAIKYAGVDGNLAKDPQFVSATDLHLKQGSPAINAGDPSIKDSDGTRSDMGAFGGPGAPKKLP